MKLRTAVRSALALLVTLSCTAVQAQAFRAYLSVAGSDSNPCSVQLPCRLLPAALNAIVDGGEVWILDSANFNTGTVTVDKSASILAVPGAVGSIVSLGGPAFSITASGLTVSLRNLVIVPFLGSGYGGVVMTGGSALTIENSLIANLPDNGVYVEGPGKLKIINTIIRNSGMYAVRLFNGATAEISGTELLTNAAGGVFALSNTATTTTASVSDSVISGIADGTNLGVFANTSIVGAVARVFVTRSTIHGTHVALNSQTNGSGSTIVAVSNSMITGNNFPWIQAGTGSVIRALGNNHITDNNAPIGVLTATALQ